jgi:CheY-like chemotaxis protein
MFYFPSTTLFLDDNHDFLLNFVLQLDEGVAYRIFDVPQKALDYIHQKSCNAELLGQRSWGDFQSSFLSESFVLDQLSSIQSLVYNPHRFSEVSVVVVDYAMPGMDGLEFCRRIENPYIKKILLTGQADEKLAIKAFNEGLIHRYVKKSDIHAAQLITKNIHELQFDYFQSLSDSIAREKRILEPACFQDKAFEELFHDICHENKIIEYYLVDSSGSFLMLDDDANISMLIVKQKEDIDVHVEWAKERGEQKTLIDSLILGEIIPLWGNDSHRQQAKEPVSWMPTQKIMAQRPYYCTYMKGSQLLSKQYRKILSYHRYLEEVDAEELLE